MPPKAKFTRRQIIDAALGLIRDEGMDSLTARALGKRLCSSSCPVFTVFESMDEVQREVLRAAKDIYRQYIDIGLTMRPAFKGVGTQYILFAINEPKLFQLLFMREMEDVPRLDGVLPLIDESYDRILASITGEYGLKTHSAERLYKHLWIYTHGIASLCATRMCSFSAEEISSMMTDVFVGLLARIKNGEEND